MTLAQIRAALQDLGFGTDTATPQNSAINSAKRRVEGMHRWPWQEVDTAAASLALGASTLTGVPADLLHIDTVRLENGTTYLDLEYERPVEVRRLLHVDRDNGAPTLWTKHAGQILIYSRADLPYTATLDYVKSPPDLAADGDSPLWPTVSHDTLKWGAAWEMALRERDWSMVAMAKQEFRERVNEMEDELGVAQRQNSRQVVRSDFWNQF
jgi:hypothetical protein